MKKGKMALLTVGSVLGLVVLGGAAAGGSGGGGSGGGGSGGGGSGGGGSGGGGSGGGGSGGGGSGGGGSGGGGSGGGGSGKGKTPTKPTTGAGGKGTIYGDPSKLPKSFNVAGNGIWISPQCDAAAVGDHFYPQGDTLMALEPTEDPNYVPGQEVKAVLGLKDGSLWNTIAGFVDWMFANDKIGAGNLSAKGQDFYDLIANKMKARGRPRPLKSGVMVLAELIKQVSQDCLVKAKPGGGLIYPAEVAAGWGDGLWQFVGDFLTWVDDYIHQEWAGSIAFELDV